MTADPDHKPAPGALKGPNCWDCRHLGITWDVRMPYACKLMGFRSKVLPSLEVLRHDGRFCGGFLAKPNRKTTTNAAAIKPTLSVGKSSNRQDSDPVRPWIPINLIT